MDNVLIDTDVILDFFIDRQPFSEDATKIFILCENKEICGFTTPVIINNVYCVLRRVSQHDVIVEKLKQLLHILDITVMNKEIIFEALNSKFKDFEDALQNLAAIHQGDISTILTRNIKDYQKSALSVVSPEMYLKEKGIG